MFVFLLYQLNGTSTNVWVLLKKPNDLEGWGQNRVDKRWGKTGK
jgi:hypothetical protein